MAETRVELNTGFETSRAGLSLGSRICMETSTPEALANDSGVLKRKVLEPDEFPTVSLDKVCPDDQGDIDVAHVYPHEGKVLRNKQARVKSNKTNDGKSLTA